MLGGYGTLAGLGLIPLPAAVVTVLVGILGGEVVLALVVALALSLTGNVLLAISIWRRRRWRSTRRPARSQSLYRDPDELDTLTITSADLEAWWANAISVARAQVGPDAEAYVESIHLCPSPFISLRGQSITAGKHFAGTVSGPSAEEVSWYGVFKIEGIPMSGLKPPLWRSDDGWHELLSRAWLRERPVKNGVVLYDRSDRSGRYWELVFSLYMTEDQRLVRARSYSLRDGELRVSE